MKTFNIKLDDNNIITLHTDDEIDHDTFAHIFIVFVVMSSNSLLTPFQYVAIPYNNYTRIGDNYEIDFIPRTTNIEEI